MRLQELLRRAALPPADLDAEIRGLACDSRRVGPGHLFVALRGHAADGHDFIPQARARGAVAIVAERALAPAVAGGLPVVVAADGRRALAALADAFYGEPSRRVRVIGVTGTKGKSTTTWLVRSIVRAAGKECGLLGSIAYEAFGQSRPSDTTTPDPIAIQAFLAALDRPEGGWAAMEVSSHALVQERVHRVRFAAAVFTNLAPEHLDYHGSMEAYLEAKARLFDALAPEAVAAIHAAGAWCARLERTRARLVRFGVRTARASTPEVWADRIELSAAGSRFRLGLPGARPRTIRLRLLGRHNVENALAAAAALHGLGLAPEAIAHGLEALAAVPGRLEPVECGQPFRVLVDYAHTEEALARTLQALRALLPAGARLHCVFGCGGDRDRSKRPRMAAAAERHADRVVLTSDNPRTEDPLAIIGEVRRWLRPSGRGGVHRAGPAGGDRGGAGRCRPGRHRADRRQGSRDVPDRGRAAPAVR
ncbi:MAG: UDP-N-acetylmuramoyl-L-alanyl-D-glutamate--2,6-diaminopimelate ligase [Planctomycetota bacterium]|nr:MAG: UDP-N-acetylmuramoyl-L-alanyl-D-glutamate--2,6-diaminopimelate ligase [Planctomycetota bacterium]